MLGSVRKDRASVRYMLQRSSWGLQYWTTAAMQALPSAKVGRAWRSVSQEMEVVPWVEQGSEALAMTGRAEGQHWGGGRGSCSWEPPSGFTMGLRGCLAGCTVP